MTVDGSIQGVVYAILITVAFIIPLTLLRLLFIKLEARVSEDLDSSRWAIKVQQLELLSADGLKRALVWGSRGLHAISALLVIYLYVPIFLKIFPWTEPLQQPFADYFLAPLSQVWAAVVDYVPSFLNILVIIFSSWVVLKIFRGCFVAFRLRYVTLPGFHAEWAEPTYKIIRFLVLALALVMIFPLLPGANSAAFKGVSLFVGAMVTLGSTSAMGNLTSGVVLIYTRSFNQGDFVRIGDATGRVIERTLLATRLQTTKNENITIPNSTVLSSQVINYSDTSDATDLIVHTSIGLGYDVDWRKVHELLGKAATKTEHIESEPAPFVLQTSLDDFSVSYELNAHTTRPEQLPHIYSELNRNILDEFANAQIEILSPNYTSVRDGNPLTVPASKA